jgi:hypothetical protein
VPHAVPHAVAALAAVEPEPVVAVVGEEALAASAAPAVVVRRAVDPHGAVEEVEAARDAEAVAARVAEAVKVAVADRVEVARAAAAVAVGGAVTGHVATADAVAMLSVKALRISSRTSLRSTALPRS